MGNLIIPRIRKMSESESESEIVDCDDNQTGDQSGDQKSDDEGKSIKTDGDILIENHKLSEMKKGGLDKTNFEFLEEIGSGTYAKVWKAKSKVSDEYLAIKIINMEEEEYINFREVKALRSLDHKNVLKYFGSFTDENEFHIATELMGKGTVVDKGG